MLKLLSKIIGDPNERKVKRLDPIIRHINSLEEDMMALSDEALRGKTAEFRQRLDNALRGKNPEDKPQVEKEMLEELLPEAFAVVREAGRRVLNMRHFDVQLVGGIILHRGQIAEMRTGEGKTLVATLPSYLNALTGKGVHVITVNDYLAKRDSEWMGQLHRALGLEVGLIQHHYHPGQRKISYGADITYGTNNEFGFDYLRDNMATSLHECVQRGLHYAIVDEVDSILVDEARTPLIISGQLDQRTDVYVQMAKVAPMLQRDAHYKVDEKTKNILLSEEGIAHAEQILEVAELYDPNNPELAHHLVQALRSKELYRRDVEYVVRYNEEKGFDEIVIVDEFTGRLMIGRRYSDGLHQAIEAKEAVKIQEETQTLATITFQNYFRMYDKLAGMTGTAATEEAEFGKIYNLEVTVIPTNKERIRKDHPDSIYKTVPAKFRAVAREVAEMHETGRPVLVGTVSIEKSEYLSNLLKEMGIPHNVLNAKYHEQEAKIIAQAGQRGAVTIATNMAGRGTDIILGGNAEFMAKDFLTQMGLEPYPYEDLTRALLRKDTDWANKVHREKFPELDDATYGKIKAAIYDFVDECKSGGREVVEIGGLHCIGTERHESRRIDNQLRGRAGRQGDPGSSKFFLSLEDDLMRLFGGDRLKGLMDKMQADEDMDITSGMVSRSIEGAQRKVEVYHFNIRKQVLEYDDVMNNQRKIVYAERRKVLEGEDIRPVTLRMIEKFVRDVTAEFANPALPVQEWDLNSLVANLADAMPLLRMLSVAELEGMGSDALANHLVEQAINAYEAKEATMDREMMRQLELQLLLRIIDQKWIAHLHDIDSLRESIGLRAYGQKDPLLEYKREAYSTFQALMKSIQADFIAQVFHMQVVYEPPPSAFQMIMPEFFQGADEEGIARFESPEELVAEMRALGLPVPAELEAEAESEPEPMKYEETPFVFGPAARLFSQSPENGAQTTTAADAGTDVDSHSAEGK
ncbi:MAG: preprotein translocase subunit SecA [Candidatus Sericytochromatia bacterium]|nr:preprotein translocase subunit SecA [Candidatus Sericytochromatia bacterium]